MIAEGVKLTVLTFVDENGRITLNFEDNCVEVLCIINVEYLK